MNLSSTIWRCLIILLNFFLLFCPPLPAGCVRFIGPGNVTVDPGPIFRMGSNLTVYCRLTSCQLRSKISLELDGEAVDAWKVNCTTAIFHLPNVWRPQSTLLCKLTSDQLPRVVGGLDLYGGLPPDKPQNIICETTRSSDFIDCSWRTGWETYVPTIYNISVYGEKGVQIHFDQVQDADSIILPQKMLDKDTKNQLIITAYNQFGTSPSDPFILCVRDIVIPETPRIMQLSFENSSVALLRWNTTETSVLLRPQIRLCTHKASWEEREGTNLREGLMRVDDLEPLCEYEFQMRTCNLALGLTRASIPSSSISSPPGSTSSKKSLCSRWSPSVTGRSPGKAHTVWLNLSLAPSQRLHVWRMICSSGTDGPWTVTVLWKPPPPEDYSGEVQEYKVCLGNDQRQEVTCPATVSQCSVQIPAEVQALSVSIVTSYGSSPPAEVPLRHSGVFGPVLRELAPAVNGSAVFISWSWPGTKHWSTSGGDLLHYVVEWIGVPATELQWQKVAKDQNNASITGLTAGVRYNISLYAVTTRGVSTPSSGLAYSRQQKPASGPSMSVLFHAGRRIQIKWDELPVDQQRGFIKNYTIYVQTLDHSSTPLSRMASGFGPKEMWLDCPEGALTLQMTASTSAGEGPWGERVSSQPAAPAAGLAIVIVFIITIFIAIIANLMCWSCVRQRIKQRCVSWGPSWLVENLPKPGNSNAIKLLKQIGSEPSFSLSHSDPPLSPITLISWEERDNAYPAMHVEVSQPTAHAPLLGSYTSTTLVNSQPEHVGYKPQIATLASHEEEVEETEEEQMDLPASREEDSCSNIFGLQGGLLASVEVDFSDSPLRQTLLWPKTPEATGFLNGSILVARSVKEREVEVDFPSLESQQGDTVTPYMADTRLSQCTAETALTGSYFPQVVADSSSALFDAQR